MKFLTMNPVEYMHQLMEWIEEYKRVEDNQVQGKGKAKVFAQDRKDLRPNHFKPPRPRREFFNQTPWHNIEVVNLVFKEPIHHVLEKIKNKPYFKWPNKIGGDPMRRYQSLYCHYHQDQGHTTKENKTLQDFLDQLVKAGKLK